MVLVVVTKGQQEALIPLASGQKKMVHRNEASAGFSVPDSCWWSLKIPSHPSQV